jgi:hypothetical protein
MNLNTAEGEQAHGSASILQLTAQNFAITLFLTQVSVSELWTSNCEQGHSDSGLF